MDTWSAGSLSLPDPKRATGLFSYRLDLRTPKNFLARLGCKTVTKFVGFYFDETDKYAVCDNGVSEHKVDPTFWEYWKAQRYVAPVFSDIDKLWKEHGKSHGLIFDIETLTFFRAEVGAISNFLYQYYIRTNDLADL